MSGQSTGWVLRHGPRDRAMRAVLICIADAANRDGDHARPGMQAIVDGALYSEGHVRRTIAKLITEGWIEQTEAPAPGKVAEFRVLMGEGDSTARTMRGVTPRAQTRAVPPAQEAQPRANAAQTPRAQTRAVGADIPIVPITDTGLELSPFVLSPSPPPENPLKRRAHSLAVLAFEQPVKPVLRTNGKGDPFCATLGIIEQLLTAGTPVAQIEAAIKAGVAVWTLAGLQTSIAQVAGRPRQTFGPRTAEAVDIERAHLAGLRAAGIEA